MLRDARERARRMTDYSEILSADRLEGRVPLDVKNRGRSSGDDSHAYSSTREIAPSGRRFRRTAGPLRAEAIDAFFTRWLACLPVSCPPSTWQLSLLPVHLADGGEPDPGLRPATARPGVLRRNHPRQPRSGRPSRVQLLFTRQIRRRPPAGFRPASSPTASPRAWTWSTSAATSSSISRRSAPCAPRPPSTTPTFGIGRGLSNFRYLQTLGHHINSRLLDTEQMAGYGAQHACREGVRNTGGPSARPTSGQREPYKPGAKSAAVQRESEGTKVPQTGARSYTRARRGGSSSLMVRRDSTSSATTCGSA
jgi:hypothetical protein